MRIKNKKFNIISNTRGFSLIELMVVVAILGFIIIGLVTFFSGGTRSWIIGQSQLKAQREARLALDRMAKEIREGDSFDNSSGDNKLIVKFDVLGKSDLTYNWSGNHGDSLTRNTGPFLDNVHDITFVYLNQSGIIMTNPVNASKVLINLQIDVDGDAQKGGNPDIILETEISLRNFDYK